MYSHESNELGSIMDSDEFLAFSQGDETKAGSFPAARWGNRVFYRTGAVPFISERVVGLPHERERTRPATHTQKGHTHVTSYSTDPAHANRISPVRSPTVG